LTLSSLVSPFLTADLVFLILHFTRPFRARRLTETSPRVETLGFYEADLPLRLRGGCLASSGGASPLARRHRNPIGLYPTGAVIEDFAPEPGTPRGGSEKNCIQIIINYARPLILRDVLDDDFVRLARILEKQNSLQMSQVFPLRASLIRWALLFKDSISGTEEPIKLPDFHTN
jgi:hypothetical protein